MQRNDLAPGADRRMTARARGAIGHLVSRTAVKAHVMSVLAVWVA